MGVSEYNAMTNSVTCPKALHSSIWIIPMVCLSLLLITFSLLFVAYLQAIQAKKRPPNEKKNIADAFHEALFNQLYFTTSDKKPESVTSLEDQDSMSTSCGTSMKSISLEVETALHEKYAQIPLEYVEEGIEMARRTSIERRSSSISPSVHSSGSLRPRFDSQVAVDAMLPVLLGYKEKDEGVENVINLWSNGRQRSKKKRFNSSPSEPSTAATSSLGRKGLMMKRSASQDGERRRSKDKDSRRISWPDEVREEGRKNSIGNSTTTTTGRIHQTHSEPEMKEPQLEIIYEI